MSPTRESSDQPLRARKNFLFEDDDDLMPSPTTATRSAADLTSRKPFKLYLRETPAEPLSVGTKLILGIVGLIVVLMAIVALARTQTPRAIRPSPRTESSGPRPDTPFPIVEVRRWQAGGLASRVVCQAGTFSKRTSPTEVRRV